MKASRLGTSISATTVQYRSALKSVRTRIPIPFFALSFFIARNFSTMGRTLPGLQYMMSRMSSMTSPFAGNSPTTWLSRGALFCAGPELGRHCAFRHHGEVALDAVGADDEGMVFTRLARRCDESRLCVGAVIFAVVGKDDAGS